MYIFVIICKNFFFKKFNLETLHPNLQLSFSVSFVFPILRVRGLIFEYGRYSNNIINKENMILYILLEKLFKI